MGTTFISAGNYYLNPYAVPVIVVSTLLLLIGIFVLTQNNKSSSNVSFFLICVSSCIWLFGMALVYCSRFENLAADWYRYFTFFGVANIAPSIYLFSAAWLKVLDRQKNKIVASYAASWALYILAAVSPYGIMGVRKYFWGFYPIYGPVAAALIAVFTVCYVAALKNFMAALKAETRPRYREQVRFLTVAYVVTFFGACDFLPKLAAIPLYPFGYITVFAWLVLVGYSIIRYKVMDIETVIHKTLMWAALSSMVFLPLGLALFYFKELLIHLHPALSSIFGIGLFLLFMIYAKTVQPWIDHIFQRRKHDLERELVKFSDNLVHLRGLAELSGFVARTVREVLYVNSVRVVLRKENGDGLRHDDPFIRWLEREDALAQADYVDLDPRFQGVRQEARDFFQKFGAKVCVPLVLNRELIGVITLTEKANFEAYRAAELQFLSELRRAATIAFSNSMRLIEMQESLRKWNEELEEKVRQRTHELGETQKQLIQAEKLATIGTLAGGVAHEINNPLTAVLTNAQLLKMLPPDKESAESVELIEEGAKRCQAIVQKLMKYARKPVGDEATKDVDLNVAIENALTFLGYQLEQENIRLVKHLGAVPKIKGMANELEQVFTNLILNGKDAIKEAKAAGVIEIQTFEKNGSVCASVKDDGKGIPKEHLTKIFDPFFTTKEVGKGTGLGLSISFGIIEKHGGKIEVTSQPGEGSTFTVSLPK
ncbi:hypothetical protein HY626_04135 [Candidatus Uhrbacteria bacterium]|nr:hypothetical protein [Candidatus Uhrbacteria bacterium]